MISGTLSLRGFEGVMAFIASEGGTSFRKLCIQLAQGLSEQFCVDVPTPNRHAPHIGIAWVLQTLEVQTSDEWKIVSAVEPLFHDAWRSSDNALAMLRCSRDLFPPNDLERRSLRLQHEIRLALCDLADPFISLSKKFRYKGALETARAYAYGKATEKQLDEARYSVTAYHEGYDAVEKTIEKVTQAICTTCCNPVWVAQAIAYGFSMHHVSETSTLQAINERHKAYFVANAENAAILRKSLGLPPLMLLMR